jgi:hypothetical protein
MKWTKKIPSAFGTVDKEFAGHPSDIAAAQELLRQALVAGVGFDEYKLEIEKWLRSNVDDESHIDDQMSKVKSIQSYFLFD